MRSKLKKVQSIIKDSLIDAWIIMNAENKDPYYIKLITPNTTILSIAIIMEEKTIVFVHSLDADNLKSEKDFKVITYSSSSPLEKVFVEELNNLKELSSVALNFSTCNDANVDTIGHGFFLYIQELLSKTKHYSGDFNLQSAEDLIYAWIDKKEEEDIRKMKVAARRANEILKSAFSKVKVGMSELEVVSLVHDIICEKPDYFISEGVKSETFSWEKESCPIVLTGKSFEKGGHAMSSDRKIEEGNTLYFDFGVKLEFEDGSFWSSDIQRTGYVLKTGEKKPPMEITNRFNVIIDSITKGIEALSPTKRGWEIDKIVRDYILENGYPDYDHATGHPIGELAHNPGTVLSPNKTKLSQLRIQQNGVYTIEPRIPLENGVSIEEMIFVGKEKNETLCERQLYPILLNLQNK